MRDHTGRTFTYQYSNGDLTRVTASDHPVLTYGYDAAHRLTALGGAAYGSVTYGYDAEGRVIQAGQATYAYEAGATLYTDPLGGIWRHEMDESEAAPPPGRPAGTGDHHRL